MGIYDRDYFRDPPARRSFGGGGVRPWSVTTWLIVINVAVFLLDGLLVRQGIGPRPVLGQDVDGTLFLGPPTPPLYAWGYFSVVAAVLHAQAWRFVTFQFLHAGLNHILVNMVGLFFFGPLVEEYLGRGRYLAFYLLCGAAGPVMYMLLWAMHLLGDGPATPLVGASAGIFGVLIAAARVAPNVEVLVMGVVPASLRTVAWVLLAVAVGTVFTAGHNAGGEAAHLGGAAVGYALIRRPELLAWANGRGGGPRGRTRYRR